MTSRVSQILAGVGRLSISVIVLAAGTARAGTLATGPVQADSFFCSAVNVGVTTIGTVTIEVINSGTGTVLQTRVCSDLEPRHECVAFQPEPGVLRGYCQITVSGAANSVRGNLVTTLGGTVFIQEAN